MAMLRFLPQGGTKPRALIVLLHGVGGDAASMELLAIALSSALANTAVVVPDAPFPFDLGNSGYQWFSVAGVTATNRDARIQNALPMVEALIAKEAKQFDLPHDRIGVCGFSQGAMMALALADRPEAPRFIASIAGRIAREPKPQPNRAPHIFLTHGDADQTVPFACLKEAITALRQANFPATALAIRDQGHFIGREQADAVCNFFARAFDHVLEVTA